MDDNPRQDLERQLAGLLRLVKWAVAGFFLLLVAAFLLGMCAGIGNPSP